MEIVKKLITKKGLSDIFLLAAWVMTICGLVGYMNSGVTDFNPSLSNAVIVPLSFLVALGVILLVYGSKYGKILYYAIAIYALVEYINTQATYITNVFVSIDGSTFSVGFILTIIALILAFGLSLTSAILAKDDLDLINSLKEGKTDEASK